MEGTSELEDSSCGSGFNRGAGSGLRCLLLGLPLTMGRSNDGDVREEGPRTGSCDIVWLSHSAPRSPLVSLRFKFSSLLSHILVLVHIITFTFISIAFNISTSFQTSGTPPNTQRDYFCFNKQSSIQPANTQSLTRSTPLQQKRQAENIDSHTLISTTSLSTNPLFLTLVLESRSPTAS